MAHLFYVGAHRVEVAGGVVVREEVLEGHLQEAQAAHPHARELLVRAGPVLRAVRAARSTHLLAVDLHACAGGSGLIRYPAQLACTLHRL